jgi:negative regulator of flagellin synthesis FlgM
MNIPSGFERTEPALETLPAAAPEKTATQSAPVPQPSVQQLSVDDQAHLSALANIVSQSLARPDVRTDKVAAVQAALASGSYHVDASAVAGKVITHLLGEGS